MRKIAYLITISIVIALCSGCNNQEDFDCLISSSDQREVEDIDIIPRALHMPDVNRYKQGKLKQSRSYSETGSVIVNSEILLGQSYKIGNSIIGDYSNVGGPVIDLGKVKEKGSKRIISKDINLQDVKAYTYYNFDQFTDSTSITRKFSSGFSLNLGLFKIGRKKITTEIFKSAYTSSNESVFGELNILYRKSQFKLDATSGARKLYARECLSDEFQYDFNTSPIGSILDQYGPYVLIGYETGGKALGLYAAKTKSGASYHLHAKNLKDSIYASFSLNKDSISADATLKFKMDNGHVETSKQVLKESQLQIRTYGGFNNRGAIIGPMEIKNMSIDLTDWLQSLTDVNTHID